jgi:hypothetical protein
MRNLDLKNIIRNSETFSFFLSNYQSYRKWIGGHWEKLWIGSPVCGYLWINCEHDSGFEGLNFHRVLCEDYYPNYESNTPYR